MSLLKWKELAKRKSELGDKINTVRNAIIQHDLGQKTSQASFSKVFQPITTKLDNVITSNLTLPSIKRRALKKVKCQIMALILKMKMEMLYFSMIQISLSKKLELIVGEILPGNSSINMRKMGVNILDKLLKTSTINKSQHNKLYKRYFQI